MTSDAELLRQYVHDRVEAAFAELLRRHVDLVYGTALRKVGRDAHAAADVSQAVFIALAHRGTALVERRTLAGWLYLTTCNIAAQHVRADRRRQNREMQAHAMNEVQNSTQLEWDQLRPVLDDALHDLNDKDREAVLLRYFEQRPFAEIGAVLRTTEDAARMRVDRALEKLRTVLARRGVSSTAAALGIALGNEVAAAPAGLAVTILGGVAAAPVPLTFTKAVTKFLMSPSTIIPSVIAVIAVGAAVLQSKQAGHNAGEIRALADDRQAVSAKLDQTADQLRKSERRVADLQAQLTRPMPASTVDVRSSSSLSSAEPESQRIEGEAGRERQAALARLQTSYEPLFRKLGLSPVQQNRFKRLIGENFQRHGDLRTVSRSQRLDPNDPDVGTLESEANAELERRVGAEFGESAADAFRRFNELAPMREFAGHASTALSSTGAPLSSLQSDQLVDVLQRHRVPGATGEYTRNPWAVDIEAVLRDAEAFLSPVQREVIRRVHANRG